VTEAEVAATPQAETPNGPEAEKPTTTKHEETPPVQP